MEQKSRFRLWHIPLLILLILGTVWIALSEKHPADIPFQRNEGAIFGTTTPHTSTRKISTMRYLLR